MNYSDIKQSNIIIKRYGIKFSETTTIHFDFIEKRFRGLKMHFEEIEGDSPMTIYDWIIVCVPNPNSVYETVKSCGIELSFYLLDASTEQPVTLENGWTVEAFYNNFYYYQSWDDRALIPVEKDGKRKYKATRCHDSEIFTLKVRDKYNNNYTFSHPSYPFRELESCILYRYVAALKECEQYDNVIEYELLNWGYNQVGFPGNKFDGYREFNECVKQELDTRYSQDYISIYQQYLENPMYQRNVSEEHKIEIMRGYVRRVTAHIEKLEKEKKELEKKISKLEGKDDQLSTQNSFPFE